MFSYPLWFLDLMNACLLKPPALLAAGLLAGVFYCQSVFIHVTF